MKFNISITILFFVCLLFPHILSSPPVSPLKAQALTKPAQAVFAPVAIQDVDGIRVLMQPPGRYLDNNTLSTPTKNHQKGMMRRREVEYVAGLIDVEDAALIASITKDLMSSKLVSSVNVVTIIATSPKPDLADVLVPPSKKIHITSMKNLIPLIKISVEIAAKIQQLPPPEISFEDIIDGNEDYLTFIKTNTLDLQKYITSSMNTTTGLSETTRAQPVVPISGSTLTTPAEGTTVVEHLVDASVKGSGADGLSYELSHRRLLALLNEETFDAVVGTVDLTGTLPAHSGHDQTTTLTGGLAHSKTLTVTIRQNTDVTIKVRGNPTTGHVWDVDLAATSPSLRLGRFEKDSGSQELFRFLLGHPGIYSLTIVATQAGSAQLTLKYSRRVGAVVDFPASTTIFFNVLPALPGAKPASLV